MLGEYLRWYDYAQEAIEYPVENIVDLSKVSKIVVTGMGGSGIVGDILASLAPQYSDIAVYVFKDFYIPKTFLSRDAMVLAISYSGNTSETLSAAIQALNRGAKVGVVTAGGRLLEFAKSKSIPYIVVRGGLVPRLAMPMMLIASVKLISECNIDLIPLNDVKNSLEVLRDVEKASAKAKDIAELLYDSIVPTVVATNRYQALAYRFKNEINENSKMPVKVEVIPELFHNDIVGWEGSKLKDVAIVINSDVEYENKLIEFYENYLKSVGIRTYILSLDGDIIKRYLFGSLVAGIASVYIANLRGLDPIETKSIAMYKNVVKALESNVIEYHSR